MPAFEEPKMHKEAPIACTLTKAELPGRIASARELGASALIELEVADRRALLRFDGQRDRIDDLVAAESECCSFLSFDISEQGEQVVLEIVTPEGGEPVLRGLVASVVAGWEGGLG